MENSTASTSDNKMAEETTKRPSDEAFLEHKSGGVVAVREPGTKGPVLVHLVESSSNTSGLHLVDPNRTTKCSDPTDLIELARQVQKGEEFIRARAVGRLGVIAEQIRFLQEQAKRVLQEAQQDGILHHAACNFKKIPGTLYYLYERQSGQHYFSMISPEEWGSNCPHNFLGCYRLEFDMSWTPADQLDAKKKEIDLMDSILGANKSFNALEFTKDTPTPMESAKSPLSNEAPTSTKQTRYENNND